MKKLAVIAVALALQALPFRGTAGTVSVAVAANVLPAIEEMAETFARETDHGLRISSGSTGRLYAQIRAGAPYDVFLAADAERPERLEGDGLVERRRTYALGRLALVGPPGTLDDPAAALRGQRLTVADPAVAPYGLAAMETLTALGLKPQDVRLVTGESVGQTAMFVATGNAPYGFLARSLLPQVRAARDVDVWDVPPDHHAPIRQDAALLSRGASAEAALAFWDWLQGDAARAILSSAGYEVPD
ncbi:molybdate ABC transporter substrate-binding protein [Tranquillimonas alkanivorans]|uniref:Molybdate transport system substrate-binding protein n=1 Tax=Tranquillimonas alkanivorans TaxID=441119 RepID=A0A1I5P1S9_9RHOB|nr:molybdate ABC transporter substrate-binding protein [Tranquillimonas alkanivorans]SFP28058.1 molybdate transport system substrate-binding protein [Tranquillimonas alkanivorans]